MTPKRGLAWKLQVLGQKQRLRQNPPREDSCFREHIQPGVSWVPLSILASHFLCIWDSGQKRFWWLMSQQYVDLKHDLSLADNYIFCLWGHFYSACSYTVGKILHPPYLTTAHYPSKISKWPSSAPLQSVTEGNKLIHYSTTHLILGAWKMELSLNPPSHSLLHLTPSPSTCSSIS